MPRYALGFDFGTESVRAILADTTTGRVAAEAVRAYAHGVIEAALPNGGPPLPAGYALQRPSDWVRSAVEACRDLRRTAAAAVADVVGVGVAFTSCTMLPCAAYGTPLCEFDGFAWARPLSYAKLWKHHGAQAEADMMTAVARDRGEPWLDRYGGTIGLEWLFPKMLETFRADPTVYAAADLWLEAGDWFVWQLTSSGRIAASAATVEDTGRSDSYASDACDPAHLVRSACQAGYKALWNADAGYPSADYLDVVEPGFGSVLGKLRGPVRPPGERAGTLSPQMAELLGLPADVPVSVATIDAHAGVPGAGVADAGTMVLVLGTSACHMVNATVERPVPGVAGVVRDGLLPGFFGYETGQASVGDAFSWLARTLGRSHEELTRDAAALPPGAGGVMAIDWLNGCRTPLMDGRLSGAFVGLTLGTTPGQMYRALIEATAFGLRWIVDDLRDAGVPVERFVASGGLPGKSPLLMQVYADVLGEPIALAASDQSVALGAAILGAVAAGQAATGHASAADAVRAMARQRAEPVYRPDPAAHEAYRHLYRLYRLLAAGDGTLAQAMRELREVGERVKE